MGPDGASCYHTISPASRDVAKADWDIEREGMLCTQSSSFAAWKAIIEKLCHETKDCDYEAVKTFLKKAESFPSRRKHS